MKTIVEVNEDCEITYSDGSWKPCEYHPSYTFAECAVGYGPHGQCPKWEWYHRKQEKIDEDYVCYGCAYNCGNRRCVNVQEVDAQCDTCQSSNTCLHKNPRPKINPTQPKENMGATP